MKKLGLTFLLFFIPQSGWAASTWAAQLAEVLIDTTSSLSYSIFLILQDGLRPIFIVLSVFWILLYMFSLFLGEKLPSGSEIAKNLLNRLLKIAVIGVFFITNPSFFFDFTISPLIDLSLAYGGEIMKATDIAYFKCLDHTTIITDTKTLFSPELQTSFKCLMEHLYTTLMFGVNMGLSLLLSSLGISALIPGVFILSLLKIIFGSIIAYNFFSLMTDVLWRFVDMLFHFILGAVLLPFSFIGWAFKDEESKMLSPYLSSWGGQSKKLFQQGVVNLIFWCISIAFLQYMILMVMETFDFSVSGSVLTPEKIIAKDPEFFNTDGSFKDIFITTASSSFLPSFKGWLLLLAVAHFAKNILKKIEEMASQFGGDNGQIYGDLKKAGQNVEKWGQGQFKTLKGKVMGAFKK